MSFDIKMEENQMNNVMYEAMVVLTLIGIYVLANLPSYIARLQKHRNED
jgi:hypothetical protein